MAKRTTPTFIVELPLSVSRRDESELLVRLDVCRQLYNACLGEALRRLDRMRDSLDWQRAKALKGKALAQARGEAFQATRAKYGFTSASISAYGTACKNAAHWNVGRKRTDPRLGAHETHLVFKGQVMRPERTFWGKATAIHVSCAQGSFRGGDRYARHWHDVTRLDAAGFADSAAKDRALAHAVAEHMSIFFAESMPDGAPIDYRAAVTRALDLAPGGDARKTLAEDYQRMVEDGLLLDDAEPFDVLMQRCQALALKVNAAALGAA